MAFNVMARNCDDHTKNHAFLLREGGRWELAPAYDIPHAYNPSGQWTYQHLMGVNGKFDCLTRYDLMAVANRFGLVRTRRARAPLGCAVWRWLWSGGGGGGPECGART